VAFTIDIALIKKKSKSAASCGDKMACIKLSPDDTITGL
jgi:hypothetical protein